MKVNEQIETTVTEVGKELANVEAVEGLCYYASNNICYDLTTAGVEASMLNIRELADVDYDHYFVLASDNSQKYLIDLTFNQFIKQEGYEIRFFNDWPSVMLKQTKIGNELLEHLAKQGYDKIDDQKLGAYISSFNPDQPFFFSVDDIMPSKYRK